MMENEKIELLMSPSCVLRKIFANENVLKVFYDCRFDR